MVAVTKGFLELVTEIIN
jgi:ankyrin repeat protein